jgi:hypothetical protein
MIEHPAKARQARTGAMVKRGCMLSSQKEQWMLSGVVDFRESASELKQTKPPNDRGRRPAAWGLNEAGKNE